jgi:hypothetical protein
MIFLCHIIYNERAKVPESVSDTSEVSSQTSQTSHSLTTMYIIILAALVLLPILIANYSFTLAVIFIAGLAVGINVTNYSSTRLLGYAKNSERVSRH